MTGISKNIKKLRTEKKLTQEQLAEKINVTRQTISSWETNRTQPDIEMLASLAEALQTDIEELIYGKKKNIGLEPDKTQNRKTLSTVLIIMGSLLSAIGIVFIFVYFWEKIPGIAKTAMAFLPLAAGAAFALFTLIKKKDSLAFRESAGVLWCAGVFATNALINSVFNVDFGFENLLIADVVLMLPAIFILDSVFLFTAETVISTAAIFFDASKPLIYGFFAVFAVAAVYVFVNKQEKPIKKYCAWIALLAAGAHALFISLAIDDELLPFCAVLTAFFLAMYVADKGKLFELRLGIPGQAVLCAGLFVLTIIARIDDVSQSETTADIIFSLVWSLICLVPAFIVGKDTFKKNPVKLAFTVLFSVLLVFLIFTSSLLFIVLWTLGIGAGVLLIISGVQKGKIYICNLGMIMTSAEIIVLLSEVELDFLGYGAVFLSFGALFLIANKIMLKKMKKPENTAETEANGNA